MFKKTIWKNFLYFRKGKFLAQNLKKFSYILEENFKVPSLKKNPILFLFF